MAKLGTSSPTLVASRRDRQRLSVSTPLLSALMCMLRLALFAVVALAGISEAAAQVPDCDSAKLTEYLKLGADGCAVGKYRLSNFAYTPGPDGLAANSISITAGISPGSDDPGILIEGNWSRPLRQPSTISYNVEPLPAGRLLDGATLEMEFGQVTDTGEASVATEVCPAIGTSDHCAVANVKLHVTLSATAQRKASDNGRLAGPASHLRVTNAVNLAAGKNGSASFTGFMLVLHAIGNQSPTTNGH
jgi:hypothetical protein